MPDYDFLGTAYRGAIADHSLISFLDAFRRREDRHSAPRAKKWRVGILGSMQHPPGQMRRCSHFSNASDPGKPYTMGTTDAEWHDGQAIEGCFTNPLYRQGSLQRQPRFSVSAHTLQE
jgi:hypothetical protein